MNNEKFTIGDVKKNIGNVFFFEIESGEDDTINQVIFLLNDVQESKDKKPNHYWSYGLMYYINNYVWYDIRNQGYYILGNEDYMFVDKFENKYLQISIKKLFEEKMVI